MGDHLDYVQRKKGRLKFSKRAKTMPVQLPAFLKNAQMGGINCAYYDRKKLLNKSDLYQFEVSTLVLTPFIQPVQFDGVNAVPEARLTHPVVELYLMHVRKSTEPFSRTPASWHVCETAVNGFQAGGKWGCPILVLDTFDRLILYHLTGDFQYGVDLGGAPLITSFDNYLVEMLLPNQSLCYFAIPKVGEQALIQAWQAAVDTNPSGDWIVGVDERFEFYDDLQMWITPAAHLTV